MAFHAIGAQRINVVRATSAAHQQTQLRSLLQQQLGNVAADESGCTCDEGLQANVIIVSQREGM